MQRKEKEARMFLNFPGHRMCKMRTVNVCKGKFDIFKNNKARMKCSRVL